MKTITPATVETLADYAREINTTHALAKNHAELAVVFAVRTGLLCNQAKGLLPHGNFREWLMRECAEITPRTAQKYMQLVDVTKCESGSYLKTSELIDPAFAKRIKEQAAFRETMVEGVKKAVGDGSLTQLYRTYGVIAEPTATTKTTRFSPPAAARGIYTPHACALHFSRAFSQTVERVGPVDEWTEEMRRTWADILEPIALFHARLTASTAATDSR